MGSSRRARPARRQWNSGDLGDLDERRLIIDALRHLSAEERAVIRRSLYSRWTTVQIAADLQVADSVVKGSLHDALRALDFYVRRIHAQRAQQV
jgi:DNA-directed RNA polymerase specialized sigma24 family protein